MIDSVVSLITFFIILFVGVIIVSEIYSDLSNIIVLSNIWSFVPIIIAGFIILGVLVLSMTYDNVNDNIEVLEEERDPIEPLELLKLRLARGEINREEFLQKATLL